MESLQRQLKFPSPEIPSGAGKEDLLALEKLARMRLSDNHRLMARLTVPVITDRTRGTDWLRGHTDSKLRFQHVQIRDDRGKAAD